MSQNQHLLEENVYADQVRMLYRALPASVLANIAAGFLIVGIQWNAIPHWVLLSWLVAFEAAMFLRGGLYFTYRHRRKTIENYRPWGKAFNLGAIVSGLFWGMAGIIMFPSGNELYQMTLIFGLLGMSAGAVSSHSFLKTAPIVFVCLTLTPLLFRFLFEDSQLGYMLALTLVLCVLYLLSAAKRNCEITVENIRLRYDAIEKEKALEKANRAKSEFLSSMSHELRTPLNAIVGFGQLLELDSKDEINKESASHIVKAGRHLTNMINEILDISRIEAGHYGLTPETVRISKALTETWALIQPLAKERKITLSQNACIDCDIHIHTDLQRFKQILLNFMSNAIKYNHEGGSVGFYCDSQPDNTVRISIQDSGTGIDKENIDRVFIPFERLNADKGNVEGSGIGLALCKSLVDAMGGKIGVASKPGIGSTFWIEFPIRKVDTSDKNPGQFKNNPVKTTDLLKDKQITIVYVEDNIANLTLIETTFAQYPALSLIPAMQGKLGYDLILKHQPDLVLLDLHLPDLPGWEILKMLKSNPSTRKIPVIIISADATTKQIEKLESLGAFAYLTKPFNIIELVQTIESALKEPQDQTPLEIS